MLAPTRMHIVVNISQQKITTQGLITDKSWLLTFLVYWSREIVVVCTGMMWKLITSSSLPRLWASPGGRGLPCEHSTFRGPTISPEGVGASCRGWSSAERRLAIASPWISCCRTVPQPHLPAQSTRHKRWNHDSTKGIADITLIIQEGAMRVGAVLLNCIAPNNLAFYKPTPHHTVYTIIAPYKCQRHAVWNTNIIRT